jgi:hypothetical protein
MSLEIFIWMDLHHDVRDDVHDVHDGQLTFDVF